MQVGCLGLGVRWFWVVGRLRKAQTEHLSVQNRSWGMPGEISWSAHSPGDRKTLFLSGFGGRFGVGMRDATEIRAKFE